MSTLMTQDEERFVLVAARTVSGTATRSETDELLALIEKYPAMKQEFLLLQAEQGREAQFHRQSENVERSTEEELELSRGERFFELAFVSLFRELRPNDRAEFEELWRRDPRSHRRYESLKETVGSALNANPAIKSIQEPGNSNDRDDSRADEADTDDSENLGNAELLAGWFFGRASSQDHSSARSGRDWYDSFLTFHRMMGNWKPLEAIVARLTADRLLHQNLMYEGFIRLARLESKQPGRTRSWYLQKCRLHLLHLLSSGGLKGNNRSFLEVTRSTLERFPEAAKRDLEKSQQAIEPLVRPVKESLEQLDFKIQELVKSRVGMDEGLNQQVKTLLDSQNELRLEIANLVRALGTPHVPGRWGEIQLKRVVEMAGMLDHCDFYEQPNVTTDEGRLRPDLIVRLPGGKNIVVDAKAPLAAYLTAIESHDEPTRRAKFQDHARQIRDHLTALSKKSYWEQFQPSPEFVVLFLPGDNFYSAALDHDPALLEQCVEQRVILATPMMLIAVLRTVACGWRQENLSAHAQEMRDLGKELYDRLADMSGHFNDMGSELEKAVESYNRAVGSLESRVLVSARKFRDLETTGTEEEIVLALPVETVPRHINASESVRLNPPIEYDNQRYGYHCSRPVEQFPGVAVTEADVFALLVAHKTISQYRGTPFQKPLEAAFEKLTSNLDRTAHLTLGSLDEALSFRPFAPEDTDLKAFEVLFQGVQEHRVVRFQYRKLGVRKPERRQVHPHHLACIENVWYLFAFDMDREAMRTFVLTRLSQPELTSKRFTPRRDFNVDEYLRGSFSVVRGGDDYEVVIEFDAWAADLLRSRRWHPSQEIVEIPGSGMRFRVRLNSLEEVERWVLSWGTHATVVRPLILARRIEKTAAALREKYSEVDEKR